MNCKAPFANIYIIFTRKLGGGTIYRFSLHCHVTVTETKIPPIKNERKKKKRRKNFSFSFFWVKKKKQKKISMGAYAVPSSGYQHWSVSHLRVGENPVRFGAENPNPTPNPNGPLWLLNWEVVFPRERS